MEGCLHGVEVIVLYSLLMGLCLLLYVQLPPMRSFTFLRLTPDMMTPSYQDQWHRFMRLMARNAQKFKTSPGWRKNMGFL